MVRDRQVLQELKDPLVPQALSAIQALQVQQEIQVQQGRRVWQVLMARQGQLDPQEIADCQVRPVRLVLQA